jgi:hypothetical protein
MKSLIAKFENELRVSRREAAVRVALTFFMLLLAIGVVAAAVAVYPRQTSATQVVQLLPGSRFQIASVNHSDLTVTNEQFQLLSQGSEVFVVLKFYEITYYCMKNGVSFRCYQKCRSDDWRYSLNMNSAVINQDSITTPLATSGPAVSGIISVSVIGIIVIFLVWFDGVQKHYGNYVWDY